MAAAWERQPGESARAFAAFGAYRDLGPQRSTAKVGQQLGKSKDLMDRWCARWRWVERAIAWDAEQDRLLRLEQEEARKEMARRHASLAVAYQRKILERLQQIRPEELSPRDLAYWLDISVKVERLAQGEPTAEVKNRLAGVPGQPVETKQVDGSVSPGTDYSDEEAASILSILVEAGAIPAPPEEGGAAAAE